MATKEELQQKLLAKLRELFQLDQPDLDFGFYRVMHAKAKEINDYLDNKLPAVISAAFKDSDGAKLQQDFDAAKQAVTAALGAAAIKPDGSLDAPYAATPMGQQYAAAKVALETGTARANGEADVYDHLYHFFERYYDKGDFVSLRYLTRETDRKAKPYAIPYAGEEVMLHWANADQYYIKTSLNFSHFTFDAAQHPDIVKMDAMARLAANVPEKLKVHFEIVDADEGDHGNIKAGKERFFILHDEKKCEVKDGEVYVYFEYREDPEKTGKTTDWQVKRRTEAVEALKTELPTVGLGKELCDFLFLNLDDGVKGKEPRILLDVYLKRYFARNTSDYFIHKDLGGFLRRELDFYIKNDLMVLDNVAAPNTTAESVAKWLDTLKVFRRIADDIITFLAQLEDFQKKLWLKKKFIVQCDYCLTMDRVPEELRADVLANPQQLEAWKKLGTDVDPKTVDMAAIDARMVDTQYFDEAFKQKLLNKIEGDFDEQCDGVLVHGDNFGALNLLKDRYSRQVKGLYIDPPYNTSGDGFIYRDAYQHSSWLSMICDRLNLGRYFATDDAAIAVSIDENEQANLRKALDATWGAENYVADFVWAAGRKNDSKYVSISHEYMLCFAMSREYLRNAKIEWRQKKKGLDEIYAQCEKLKKQFKNDYAAMTKAMKAWYKSLPDSHPAKAHKHYSVIDERGVYFPADISWPGGGGPKYEVLHPVTKKPVTVPSRGWIFSTPERMEEVIAAGNVQFGEDETSVPCLKSYLKDKEYAAPYSVFYQDGRAATKRLRAILGNDDFGFPKDELVIADTVSSWTGKNDLWLDYFAGSGTTAHAVIDLNRQDGGHRKYILIEMGDHFDTVLMPRVQKVVYSPDWKDGKPTAAGKGISHCFKYLRLESYEDALNNLQVDGTKGAAFAGVGDYFLKYMLDVETKGSPSLLNVESFANPFGYRLVVKKPGSEEREERTVDLVETFNYLIGLRVKNTAAMKRYTADFERPKDEELPEDGHTKLVLKGGLKLQDDGAWAFRLVEGWCPKNRATPNDGAKERVLVVWRTLTGDTEKDNAVLNAFLQRKDINALDGEYDVIYVNGSNNVPNLRKDSDTWKVRLIEEEFRARMWEGV